MKTAVVDTRTFPYERYAEGLLDRGYKLWLAEQLAMQGIRLAYSFEHDCRVPAAPCELFKTFDGRIIVRQEE